jgi:hypothetical protein
MSANAPAVRAATAATRISSPLDAEPPPGGSNDTPPTDGGVPAGDVGGTGVSVTGEATGVMPCVGLGGGGVGVPQ